MHTIGILNNETWVVCGGRKFSDAELFESVMSQLVGMFGCPTKIVHGDAPGLDRMAGSWAERMAISVVAVPAEWDKHGDAAGPIRNEDMLMQHRPKRVIAFPGGKGTADMVRRVRNRSGRIDLIEIRPDR